MPAAIDVSVVITLYNKERYIADTLTSIFRQDLGLKMEYILVDDVSSDRTVDIVRDLTRDMANVTIICNQQNAGPSMRVNQGVRLARGKYIFCFDSDDILAGGALRKMFDLLETHDGDVIYGKWEKTELSGKELLSHTMPENPDYHISDTPMEYVLNGRFLRMLMMARREVFENCGGADERIFIQDESLALRLAAYARRFIALDAVVMVIPKIEGALSRNRSQLNHDRFLANYYALKDGLAASDRERRLLYQRCVSAAWKQHRQQLGSLRSLAHPFFLLYLRSKSAVCRTDDELLERLSHYFASLDDVRRMPE